MAMPIYKVLLFLKRSPELTAEAFRAEYEATHAPWAVMRMPTACRYVRRYSTFVGAPHAADVSELDFDVITEAWYENADEAAAAARNAAYRAPEEDSDAREGGLFHRPSMRVATVVEYDSDMSAAQAPGIVG